jgi:hypothetical protein
MTDPQKTEAGRASNPLNQDNLPTDQFEAILRSPWTVWQPAVDLPGAAGRQREVLLGEIGAAMASLASIAAMLNRYPRAEATMDALDAHLLRQLFVAGDRLQSFRAALQCLGEA